MSTKHSNSLTMDFKCLTISSESDNSEEERSYYPKDSFKRFGDDLSEVLLSYLSFEEMFRFECVSIQWQTLIFCSQKSLIISDKFFTHFNCIDINILKTVLNKCPNIQMICFTKFVVNKSEVSQMIVENCSQLNEIQFKYKLKTDDFSELLSEIGPKLKRLYFEDLNTKFTKNVLKLCPNLEIFVNRRITVFVEEKFENFFNGNEILLKNLKSFTFNYFPNDSERLEIFVENNKNSLKSIAIIIREKLSETHFDHIFNQLLKLRKLLDLKIGYSYRSTQSLVAFIEKLAKNCPFVKNIDLFFDFLLEHFNKVLESLNLFEKLTRLSLHRFSDTVIPIVKPVLNCKNLRLLVIDGEFQITDEFFSWIVTRLPKLQFMRINSFFISELTFKYLTSHPNLKSIIFDSKSPKPQINETLLLDLILKCPKLEVFILRNEWIIILFTENQIQELREGKVPKRDITFRNQLCLDLFPTLRTTAKEVF